jgi:phage-related protein
MVNETQKTPLHFYKSSGGNEPVREWLKDLDEPDRHAIGQDLMRAQWRWPVGMPLCRPMGNGLWEIRTDLPSNRIARVLVCLHKGRLVALHGFIKKSQKTPDDELALAKKRQKEL